MPARTAASQFPKMGGCQEIFRIFREKVGAIRGLDFLNYIIDKFEFTYFRKFIYQQKYPQF